MANDDGQALRRFRAGLFVCCTRRRDALLEVLEAKLTTGAVPSLPHLSLAPGHRRGWGSVCAALRRGHISFEALRSLLVRQPMPAGSLRAGHGTAPGPGELPGAVPRTGTLTSARAPGG